jgi:hypothetical protein
MNRMERKVGFQATHRQRGTGLVQGTHRIPVLLSIFLAAGSLVIAPAPVRAQAPGDSGPSSNFYQPRGLDQQHRRILLLQFNAVRQKQMVSDAEKLLQLAGELDAEVRAAGDNPLSAGQLSKIASIQKLAHSVKDKMQFAVLPY